MRHWTIIILACCSCESAFFEEQPANNLRTNFEIFWNDFDRYYSYFELKGVDWDSVYVATLSEIDNPDSNPDLFTTLENCILLFEDGHVNLYTGFATVSSPLWSDRPRNGILLVDNYVDLIRPNPTVQYGIIRNTNIGYISVRDFQGPPEYYEVFNEAFSYLSNTDGLIVDARDNVGGSDIYARWLVGLTLEENREYQWIRYRNGPARDDFSDWIKSSVTSRTSSPYLKNAVILTNRKTFSSGESLTLMMRANPRVTHVGDTTGGGSGNPVFRELPNGWSFRLSSWQATDHNRQFFEGTGIYPHVPVWLNSADSIAGIDSMIETALDILSD